uniref:Uncharacterized protein n=1 Tax=Anguilla anguilla TaxID=7936 RepID=A0A0E9VXA9_ANGAN
MLDFREKALRSCWSPGGVIRVAHWFIDYGVALYGQLIEDAPLLYLHSLFMDS